MWFLRYPVSANMPVAATAASALIGSVTGGTLAAIQTADGTTYDIGSAKVASIGQAAQLQADYLAPMTDLAAMSISLKAKAAVKSAGSLAIYNWKTKAFITLQSFTFGASGSVALTVPLKSLTSAYFDPSGKVRVMLKATLPGTKAFSLQTDLLQLLIG
jgi:hypothetical protein